MTIGIDGSPQVTLYGYTYSVYLRIVRMTLIEKGVGWRHVEIDPFSDVSADYLALNPFGRVPTLVHGAFSIYETAAITRYIDDAFEGPKLQPERPADRARMAQLIAIMDSYGYWPLVRQVFSHRVFRPAAGDAWDENEIAVGLARAQQVLAACEELIGGAFLVGGKLSLADTHFAPMFVYFAAAPEGERLLDRFPKLAGWWRQMRRRPSLQQTDAGLPG